jgi:hypothetical protein
MDPSLFQTIMGGGDQTPDPQSGLTNADRSQIGFGSLGQIGALLMAAGQPMWGNERARILAQLGNVPGQIGEAKTQAVQRKRLNQQFISDQRSNAAAADVQKMADDPATMEGLNPQQAALMKAAFRTGDMGKIVALQKENREANQPVPLGNGMFWDRSSNTAVNPYTNTRYQLGQNGQSTGQATYLNGKPVEEGDEAIDPATGNREAWLGKQDQWLRDRLKRIAAGDEQMPGSTSRSPDAIAIRNGLAHYSPNTQEQDYKTKQDWKKQVEGGGPIFQKIIRPSQTFLNHAASFLDSYDKLGMEDGWVAKNGGNYINMQYKIKEGKEGGGAIKDAGINLKGLKDEFSKFMAGSGQLTDQARREQNDIMNSIDIHSTPSEVRAGIGKMVELMHGQLQPVVDQNARSMKLPRSTPGDLLGDKGRQSLEKVMKWESKSAQPQAATPGAPAQPPTGVDPRLLEEARRRGLIK